VQVVRPAWLAGRALDVAAVGVAVLVGADVAAGMANGVADLVGAGVVAGVANGVLSGAGISRGAFSRLIRTVLVSFPLTNVTSTVSPI